MTELEKQNYFEIFSLPVQFVIDLEDLEDAYLEMQQKYHPDYNLQINQDYSALINQAYKILKDPLGRANYLAKILFNISIDKEDGLKPSMKILTEMMELQESLEDSQENPTEFAKIRHNIKLDIIKSFNEFSMNIEQKNKEESLQNLIKIKYLQRIYGN